MSSLHHTHAETLTQRTSTSPPSGTWRVLSRPQGAEKLPKGLDAAWDAAVGLIVPMVPRQKRLLKRAQRIVELEPKYLNLSDAHLREAAMSMRHVFRLGRETPADTDHAFAIVREVASRAVGMRPFLVQVAAGLAIDSGNIAEVATGEGKTLAATLPATLGGWRGKGCHVVTVNDYLAKRDAEWMGPIYKFCGLSVAHVDQEMKPPQRRDAYLADITYTTNKESTADFLRDRLVMGGITTLPSALLARIAHGPGAMSGVNRMVMRGLEQAIVDEADSVLIDEAVTPLIISGDAPNPELVDAYQQAVELAARLGPADFTVNHRWHEVELTSAGRDKLAEGAAGLGGVWAGARRSEELVTQALSARELFLRGKQYVVQDDKIVIVDESTGRLMPDRTWRDGLHQAIEAKEKITVNPIKETLARISFQRYFRLYRKLGGMTGTAWETRYELWRTYHLPVIRIPTNKPCIRVQHPDHYFTDEESKWKAVVEEIRKLHEQHRPILIGTVSVRASEHLSEMLTAQGLPHLVLNAVRHAEEAQIVAAAGQPGKITVATNMAGRGTDIHLGKGVAEKGGLHVIATERHSTARIDRQLFGRAGRQGDPGSAIAFVSLEDDLIKRFATKWVQRASAKLKNQHGQLSPAVAQRLFTSAQARAQRIAAAQRRGVLQSDDWLDETLGFAGRSD